nr:hypothetical protein [Tanacetum cinerariifolium]
MAYQGFLRVGTTFDIFQNILSPYGLNMAYWSFLDTMYWILFPSWSLAQIRCIFLDEYGVLDVRTVDKMKNHMLVSLLLLCLMMMLMTPVIDEKNDDVGTHEMGSLGNRTKKMQTTIPTTYRSLRINLSLDKNVDQELPDNVSLSTATISKDPHKKRHITRKYSHLPGALRRMCRRQGYMIKKMEQKCVTTYEFWEVYGKVDQVLH